MKKARFIPYKEQTNIEERKLKSAELLKEHPGRIPTIIEKDQKLIEQESKLNSNNFTQTKTKFLFNGTDSMDFVIAFIKSQLNLEATQSIFILVQGKYSMSGNTFVQNIYKKYKDEDGFLYFTISTELVWG